MTSEYLSSDFNYKKYSLEQLDNWVNDALNCEDLTPQDIYDTVVKCVDESVEYHKKYLTKSIELLSLLKGQYSVDFNATNKDWEDFWSTVETTPDKVREYELKERDYERQRAMLDAQTQAKSPYNDGWTQEAYQKELEKIRSEGGYEWTPGT